MVLFSIVSLFFLYFSEAGATFLTISPGARAVAMGSAFTAIADDATASYYNPAGLAFQNETSFIAMNSVFLPGMMQVVAEGFFSMKVPQGPEWLPGLYPNMRHLYLGGAIPILDRQCFAFGFANLNTGRFEYRDENGTPMGEYESYDYALIMSYGGRINKSLGIGASVKYLRIHSMPILDSWNHFRRESMTCAFDIGVLWRPTDSGLSLGASYQNFGFWEIVYRYSGNSDPLPTLCRVGIAYDFAQMRDMLCILRISKLQVSHDMAADLVEKEHEIWWCWGGEITVLDIFSLRGGYFSEEQQERSGFTWGYGFSLGAVQFDIATDAGIYEFPTENWRAQISLHSKEWDSCKPYPAVAGISSALVPGAGQFYNGDGLKGLLFATAAFALGELCYGNENDGNHGTNEIILCAIHIASIADAVIAAKSRGKENSP